MGTTRKFENRQVGILGKFRQNVAKLRLWLWLRLPNESSNSRCTIRGRRDQFRTGSELRWKLPTICPTTTTSPKYSFTRRTSNTTRILSGGQQHTSIQSSSTRKHARKLSGSLSSSASSRISRTGYRCQLFSIGRKTYL